MKHWLKSVVRICPVRFCTDLSKKHLILCVLGVIGYTVSQYLLNVLGVLANSSLCFRSTPLIEGNHLSIHETGVSRGIKQLVFWQAGNCKFCPRIFKLGRCLLFEACCTLLRPHLFDLLIK